MEYRNNKERIYIEIKKAIKEMLCVGIALILLGALGLIIFHYTSKYIIHPIIYMILYAGGITIELTAIAMLINYRKEFYPKKKVKYWMTKDEAIIAMKSGQKVTHEYFSSNEYLYIEYDIIRTEEGYDFDHEWDRRKGPEWQRGWRIYGAIEASK